MAIFLRSEINETIEALDIDLVARAHQVVQGGCKFFANKRLVTIFSALNYCGQFDNFAAIMSVDDKLNCSFQVLKPTNDIKSKK